MMSDDFEDAFARACRHAGEFRRSLADRSNPPQTDYHTLREALMAPLPEDGMAAADVVDELAGIAEPGLMAMPGPRFFGWVLGASHPAGVAADWLTSAWGQNTGYHTPTPATAALEDVAASWLLEVLDLPRQSSVGFATGATVANAIGLAAARGSVLRAVDWDVEANGLFGAPPIHVFIGDDAHTSLFSALQFIGLGHDRVVRIATDDQGRMQAAPLRREIASRTGPMIVVAQAGQINTGAFDPFPEIVRIAKGAGAWVHVDGAFGLWARACPERAQLTAGIDGADSWVTDGHKWLQTPFDCGYAIVRDAEAHQRAMTIWASYLPTIEPGDRVPSALVPELSRRGRGVATWAMLRALGRTGIAEMVGRHCAIAHRMAERLTAEPGVRVLNDVVLNQVIVQFGAGSDEDRKRTTQTVIDWVQAEGICFVGGARWRDQWVMRISVISYATTVEDADRSTESILRAWRSAGDFR
jgi:glutamate/tyrosine decarboxylase-like PLP-dependent enzyme